MTLYYNTWKHHHYYLRPAILKQTISLKFKNKGTVVGRKQTPLGCACHAPGRVGEVVACAVYGPDVGVWVARGGSGGARREILDLARELINH